MGSARSRMWGRWSCAVLVALSMVVSARGAGAAGAAPSLQVVAVVGGQPDDIAVDRRGRLIWGDLARGTVDRLQRGRIVTVAAGLSVPEGIVVLPDGSLAVAEQGLDRIVRIGTGGARTVLSTLLPVPGQEGVDGIGYSPRTRALLIPDSPRGTVLSLNPRNHRVRTLATGLGRPVNAAVDAQGNILVPDEHLGTLIVISPQGRISHRGAFATPDDVAVDRRGRVWVTTLGDNALWVIAPRAAPQRVLVGLSNPQGLVLDRCGDPVVVEQTTASIVRVLLTSTSKTCGF